MDVSKKWQIEQELENREMHHRGMRITGIVKWNRFLKRYEVRLPKSGRLQCYAKNVSTLVEWAENEKPIRFALYKDGKLITPPKTEREQYGATIKFI